MNIKTTFALLILVAAGVVWFWFGPVLGPRLGLAKKTVDAKGAGSLEILENEVTADRLTRIEIQHGDRRTIIERKPGAEWSLPGNWPTRPAEVEQLVAMVTGLKSRFVPIPLGDPPDLKGKGLEPPALTITVHSGEKSHRLVLGEEPSDTNRFSRPTYLRIDEQPEVVRLAPGLIGSLDRPPDYYQKRHLFPSERVAKETDIHEKVERLSAKSITVKGPGSSYELTRGGDDWEIKEPVRDRPDPDKLTTILTAIPDVWAEQFVDKKKDLAELGLKEPEQTLVITRPTGQAIRLLIGKQSQMKVRTVTRPAPSFGGPPMPPQKEVVHEEFRYAKLEDNEQIFEIRADKFKDIFIATDALRDARLARFRTEDAQRLEVNQGGQDLVISKEKGTWRVQKPFDAEAESSKVTELLDKLSGLQAREKDVLDKADAKSHGLDKPIATIKVTVEESKGEGEAKTKRAKTFTFGLGKQDVDKSKLYVRMDGWDRINAVEDSVLKLVQRPALAYRGRRILDFSTSDLAKIEVERGAESFALELAKGVWRLSAPVQADVDSAKTSRLTGDLSRLEAVEYVDENAKPETLEPQFGLGKPALTVKLTFTDTNKPAQTLLVGKQREGKQEYFAKLASGPGVFAIKKENRDNLDQESLAYRPLQLWQVFPDEIAELRIRREEQEYRLKRDGPNWQIQGPFEAAATGPLLATMTSELSSLKADRYVAHVAKDLGTYGLDKPYLRIVLQERGQEEPKEKKDKDAPKTAPREHVLLIGATTEKDPQARYAKLGNSEAILILPGKVVAAADHGPLELLDRKLLTLDARAIDRLRGTGPQGVLGLHRQGEEWQVTESPATPFPADRDVMNSVLGAWSNLQADRFADYGPKVELAKYGLDKPEVTLTAVVQPPPVEGKPAKPIEHTLALGKLIDDKAAERFARLNNGPGVVVLSGPAVADLNRSYLDFVNRSVLKLNANEIGAVQRRMAGQDLELIKTDNVWQVAKPVSARADTPTLDQVVEELSALRVRRIAAYPLKDAKAFGLDNPAAVVTLKSAAGAGKALEHVVKIGNVADTASGERFVQVDNSTAVGVLAGELARRLLAEPLKFRDRNLARFTDADRITMERVPRKAIFSKVDGTWKLTESVQADAEAIDLEDFVNALARLRVDELVAERPFDPKTYGLDRPEARWQLQHGAKEVLGLAVGSNEKVKADGKEFDGPRSYARLANGDLVFLLDPKLTTQALGEYRSRGLWPSLDAAQIEKLAFNYAGNPFVLEKTDNTWQAAGKPEVKVKQETIRDTLDALAGLKAARYVEDKGADMKLYGLEPALLVLEIHTRTGKRVLQIGRPEGESKRHYARVPEANRSDVFVIGEADAKRIVKTLSSFGM